MYDETIVAESPVSGIGVLKSTAPATVARRRVRADEAAVADPAAAEEGVIVTRAKAGCPVAWIELRHRFERLVSSIARDELYRSWACEEDIEDASGEVWLKVHRALPRFEDGRPFGPWISRITRNHCWNANMLVRHRFESNATDTFAARPEGADDAARPAAAGAWDNRKAEGPDPRESAIGGEHSALLRRAIGELPEKLRGLFEAHIYAEKSFRAISEETGVPLGTVLTRAASARAIICERVRCLAGARGSGPPGPSTSKSAKAAAPKRRRRSRFGGRRESGTEAVGHGPSGKSAFVPASGGSTARRGAASPESACGHAFTVLQAAPKIPATSMISRTGTGGRAMQVMTIDGSSMP
jgi:RNA polymerase sigma factor (sigma-70 family)